MSGSTAGLRDLVIARHRYLEFLEGTSKSKPQMVSHLDRSRSTVDYAMRELLEAHLVERTSEGYRSTLLGRLAHDAFESYVGRLETLEEACLVLDGQSAEGLTDSGIFESAEVLLPKQHAPQWPLNTFLEEITGGCHVRGFTPALFEPYVSTFHSGLINDDVSLEMILPSDVLQYLSSAYVDEFREMLTSSDLEVYESQRPVPFGLWIYDGATCRRVALVFHDSGNLTGVVVNDSAEIGRWARNQYEQVRTEATNLVTPGKQ